MVPNLYSLNFENIFIHLEAYFNNREADKSPDKSINFDMQEMESH